MATKFCKRCGVETERYTRGECKLCTMRKGRARPKKPRPPAILKVILCKRCGKDTEHYTNGGPNKWACRPCRLNYRTRRRAATPKAPRKPSVIEQRKADPSMPCPNGHPGNWDSRWIECKTCSSLKDKRKLDPKKNAAHVVAEAIRKPHIPAMSELKSRAKRGGFCVTITKAELAQKFQDTTHCCICERLLVRGTGGRGPSNASPSVDRVNVLIGYTNLNTQVICNDCNRAKRNLTAPQLRRIADYIDAHDSMWLVTNDAELVASKDNSTEQMK